MSVSTEILARKYLNPVAGTPINVDFPLFAEAHCVVLYGVVGLPAILDTDFTLTLNIVGDYADFTLTPTASLRTKIDALLVADPTETDQIVVRRDMPMLTDMTPTLARLREQIALEFDRTALRLQQLQEEGSRSLQMAETDVSGDSNILPVMSANKGIKRNAANDGWVETADDPDDAADAAAAALASQVAAAASAAAAAADAVLTAADVVSTNADVVTTAANAAAAASYVTPTREVFVDGVGFDAGVDNSVLLTATVASADFIDVSFDGIEQFGFSIAGAPSTITFAETIYAGTAKIQCTYGVRAATVPATDVSFDNTTLGIAAVDVQAAIDEIADNGIAALTTAEVDQLENIGATTISAVQWGYAGAQDQGVATTDSPTFAGLTSTDDITVSNGRLLQTASDTNQTIQTLTSTAATPYGIAMDFSVASPNDQTRYFLFCQDATEGKLWLYSDGSIVSAAGATFADDIETANDAHVGVGGDPTAPGTTPIANAGSSLVITDAIQPQLVFYDSGGAADKKISVIHGGGEFISIKGKNDDGTNRQDLMFFDLTNGRVGVKDTAPSMTLDITGTLHATNTATFDGALNAGATGVTTLTASDDVTLTDGRILQSSSTGSQTLATLTHSHASAPYGVVVDFSVASPDNTTNYFFLGQDATENKIIAYSNGSLMLAGQLDLSASGSGQIKFPATQNASADPNTQDDYEEGLHTGVLTCGTSGTITVNTSLDQLEYTKLGRSVHVTGTVGVSSVSSPVGWVSLSLPFVIASGTESSTRFAGTVVVDNVVSANVADFLFSSTAGLSVTYLYLGAATAKTPNSAEQFQAGTSVTVDFTYFTN